MKLIDTTMTATPLTRSCSPVIGAATIGEGPGGDRRLVVA